MSFFSDVKFGEPIEAFALIKAYKEDPYEKKVNLSVGGYLTGEGKPWILPAIRAVEKLLAQDNSLNKEYFPTLGLDSFCKSSTNLLLGIDSPAIIDSRCCGIQCLSSTGALRIGAEFLAKVMGKRVFYYSNPTLENHRRIFISAGFTDGREYRYWNHYTRSLDINALLEDLERAPQGSVIILHACAHNPTGIDPSTDEWEMIANIIKTRKLLPFFDSSYQGFASGDFVRDAYSVRKFVSMGIELFCAQSFAKNFGLYNERIGNLVIVVNDPSLINVIKSQMILLNQALLFSPPSHGARIVAFILNNPDVFSLLKNNIQRMSSRINDMRKQLREALEQLQTPGDWRHLTRQIGMFSYTGLNETQSENMVEKYHIYMMKSGRISMPGLNKDNLYYVAEAINESVTTFPAEEQQNSSRNSSNY